MVLEWDTDGRIDVPISAIEHFSYCPRQCALIHVERTYEENAYTLRGNLAHERVDSGVETVVEGVRVLRSIPLWSERYGLQGKADVVEFRGSVPYPVEYKLGRPHGPHADLQLCAQGLCLEEMLEVEVEAGAIFHHALRRRREVVFTHALRAQTIAAVDAIRAMIEAQRIPAAPNDARCDACSLRGACLPAVVSDPATLRGLQGSLFRPLEPGLDP
jgi:CRISPR-associated exonuclease Cas4